MMNKINNNNNNNNMLMNSVKSVVYAKLDIHFNNTEKVDIVVVVVVVVVVVN